MLEIWIVVGREGVKQLYLVAISHPHPLELGTRLSDDHTTLPECLTCVDH